MANPTEYVSIHEDYGSATKDVILSYSKSEYINKFRFFIPPSTKSIIINLSNSKETWVLVRHQKIPLFNNVKNVIKSNNILSDFINDNIKFTWKNSYNILSEFSSITMNNCGWFYFNCGEDLKDVTYKVYVNIEVDIDLYNTWYKSINWENDVESVEIYNDLTTPDNVDFEIVPKTINDFGTIYKDKNKFLTFYLRNTSSINDVVIKSIKCPTDFTYNLDTKDLSYRFTSLYQLTDKKGFKNTYNFPDVDFANFYLTLPTVRTYTYFKLFIPYGTSKVSLFQLETTPGADIVAIVGWQYAPTVGADNYDDPPDWKYNFGENKPSYLRELSGEDFLAGPTYGCKRFKTFNDKITIIDGTSEYDGCGWSEDEMKSALKIYNHGKYLGWLYVWLRTYSGQINNIIFESTVCVKSYYDQIQYEYDLFNEPIDDGTFKPYVPPPEQEVTLTHDPYHRVQENQLFDENGRDYFIFNINPIREYEKGAPLLDMMGQICFIPPGTISLEVGIGPSPIASMISCCKRVIQNPQQSSVNVRQVCYVSSSDRTEVICNPNPELWNRIADPMENDRGGKIYVPTKKLTEFKNDYPHCTYTTETKYENIKIISIFFEDLVEPIKDGAGWYYSSLRWEYSGLSLSLPHKNIFSLKVDTIKFNEWWDNGGKDGVIDWKNDIIIDYNSYLYRPYELPVKPKFNPGDKSINKSGYTTVHEPYYLLQENIGTVIDYTDIKNPVEKPAYTSCTFVSTHEFRTGVYGWFKTRMFLPPGTLKINVLISNKDDLFMHSWTHFKSQPKSVFPLLPTSGESSPITIEQINNEFYSFGNTLNIFKDLLYEIDSKDESGWLYINVFEPSDIDKININFRVDVDMKIFNNWWKNNGSQKLINWDIDVEQKDVY